LDTQKLIETLLERIEILEKNNAFLMKRVYDLETELAIYKNKKNSKNSHTPPSQDQNRVKKNQSLREKSDRKAGGQFGHEGNTLLCSTVIDEVVEHHSFFCNHCGNDIENTEEELIEIRQVIDIPEIKPYCTEHRVYRKKCTCGHTMNSSFPKHVVAKVQYGSRIESLVGYLHARQYLPYKRLHEFCNHVLNLPISVGGVHHLLQRLTKKAIPYYEQIKARIEQAIFVGTDETSVNINGQNDWIWTWQNEDLTFLIHSDNRGFKTISDTFEGGLPKTVLQHDRFACHFQCNAFHHQICMAHVLRDLTYLSEIYKNYTWATDMQILIREAIALKKELITSNYYEPFQARIELENKLKILLQQELHEECKKAKTLQKSLLKHQEYILYFLHHPNVPPDNNGSERAIRNVKVKQKISGQFKTIKGAQNFAIVRSVIDTTIKSGQQVLYALNLIATFGTE